MEKKEKKEAVAEAPISVAGVAIIPVTRVSVNCWRSKHGASFFGFKHPTSIVVVSPTARWAVGTDGESIPLEKLIQEVPDIKEKLESL